MNHDIVVIAEQTDGFIRKISYELIRGARGMAAQTGGRVITIIAGFGIEIAAKRLAAMGSDEVLAIDHPVLEEYLAGPYAQAIGQTIQSINPETVLFGSTTIGMELAPVIAVRLGTGLVTDCTALAICPESGRLLMTRPNTDGISIDTFICKERRPQMATVRPGVLAHEDSPAGDANVSPAAAGSLRFVTVELSSGSDDVTVLSTTRGREAESDITKARVLVSGGRGIGGPDGFKTLRALAGLLDGQIACSRACVEAGWIDASPQVGQTGKTVRPDLYLACGISGAFQHVTGMEDSRLIIAVNKNPAAPIFDIADLGIVGNVEVLLPRLIDALEKSGK